MSSSIEKNIEIDGIAVLLKRKRVRGIHLRVVPPQGEVRVSAPVLCPEEKILAFVRSKAEWIRRHQERMKRIPWTPPLQYETGEEHLYLGKMYWLEVVIGPGKEKAEFVPEKKKRENVEDLSSRQLSIFEKEEPLRGSGLEMTLIEEGGKAKRASKEAGGTIRLFVRPRRGRLQRKGVLQQGYKEELQRIVPGLVRKYEAMMEVSVARIRYRSMKTRWGTCAIRKRSITVNIELAKKSVGAIEVLVVHELAHLLERKHNDRFYGLMSRYFPQWKEYDKELKGIDNG